MPDQPVNPAERAALLLQPVGTLPLALSRREVSRRFTTILALVRTPPHLLLKRNGIGRARLREVERVLAKVGLHLGMDIPLPWDFHHHAPGDQLALLTAALQGTGHPQHRHAA